ncbi:MAG: SPOR domain-containing protein [Prevotella sp.]
MKRIAVIAILTALGVFDVHAQTFLDRLKKPTKDKAVVTVTQDETIDKLVNGERTANPQARKAQGETKPGNTGNNNTSKPNTAKPSTGSNNDATPPASPTTEPNMRKKVMKNSYKVTGYRVQAFTGGNTRKDRQNAEAVGNTIKRRFPEQPIYVHFYSPRWICRVGNFRTYEEAHAMLLEIREMGYKQASIVKGKISVQY